MITKELLREWGACWSDEDLKKHAGRRKAFTPRQIAKDERISLDDRLWVLSRTLWYLDESAARGFAIETASKVAHLAPDEDEHLGLLGWMLEIEDLPESERSAARSAASAASAARRVAYSAAENAAWSAAKSVAYSAAQSAAQSAAASAASAASAAESAAYSAAYSAARSAAWSAAESAASAARSAAWRAASAAREKSLRESIDRALEWLGDYANGWEP